MGVAGVEVIMVVHSAVGFHFDRQTVVRVGEVRVIGDHMQGRRNGIDRRNSSCEQYLYNLYHKAHDTRGRGTGQIVGAGAESAGAR